MELSIRNERIKRIDIIGEDGTVLGQVVFNPYDMGIYRKYTEIRMQLAKDKQEYEAIVKEYESIPKDTPEDDMLETGEYDKLNEIYQAESKMSGGIENIFKNLEIGIDGLFGHGVYELITQGYQDEGMLNPLFEAVKPFFDEAGKERGEKVGAAKLNRAQRRTTKK